ncbi:predicted protein [Sclerotinia sclerotiorum 1980 UF-70]|uniref:Uncharacterized protein n=1 Tax=Sclerotinia sclerotiorum (strain ATCC 18683 / 1980 / Ss-1) TaxID=665079 RepID=A7ENI8_SCLS1|nr:predicted protein [Sclerotinia sclerotiorum 1980 UF-70]EDO04404.1 predicted protein [Sclerotinia sclerotiorum 1980 UF-70]
MNFLNLPKKCLWEGMMSLMFNHNFKGFEVPVAIAVELTLRYIYIGNMNNPWSRKMTVMDKKP